MNNAKTFKLGASLGSVSIASDLAEFSRDQCASFFLNQEETDYAESVDSQNIPRQFSRDWIPQEALAEFGLCVKKDGKDELVMTTSVGHHIDAINNLTLALVISNPGFKFTQSGHGSHKHKDGDWFIFDDRMKHSAEAGKMSPEDGVYAIWVTPLEYI